MNPEEASYKKLVDQFYLLVSNEKVTKLLIESFTNSLKEEIKNGPEELSPEEISSMVFLQYSIIDFFNQIDNVKNLKYQVK